jgi:hypothetical protein
MEPENPKLGLWAKAKTFSDAVSSASQFQPLLERQAQVQQVLNVAPSFRGNS